MTNDETSIHDEEWTLIGDEEDPELVKRINDFDMAQLHAGRGNSFQIPGGRYSMDLGA